MSIRSGAAIALCKGIHKVMRLMGRTARALPGMVALVVDPKIIAELSQGHKTIVTTGTNGKTTTTHIVQQAVINTFGNAAYDPSSTNLEQGIATTLCLDSSVRGERKSDWGVIECDEGATKFVLPATNPQVLVVTNLYRDQVDRYTSWTTARDYIVEAAKSSPNTVLVLDADCQVTSSIAELVDNEVVWFGVECPVYEEGIADYDKSVTCVSCGAELEFGNRTFAHLGDWTCPSCGRNHHTPSIACTRIESRGEKHCTLALRIDGQEHVVEANVRAGYDVYNAVAAVAGLLTTGMAPDDVFQALAHFTHAAHRFEIFDVDGTPTRLLLMKNTAGCNQLINMLVSEGQLPKHLVCLLGAEIMDGISTEWIQDVRWEELVSEDTQVIVGGPKRDDMRERLLRAGVQPQNMREEKSYSALVDDIAAIGEPVTVIANCSTIEALRLVLVKQYQPLDYWAD
ncbi:MAG: MurT ligase domain-containing protein [Coriobacteriales bacterium]|nr:MurT ligase domain-containing protein [Coriobacteriales bacterium]